MWVGSAAARNSSWISTGKQCCSNQIAVRRIQLAVLAALILAPASAAAADNLAGQASVIDGDTLEIHGTRIRLWGIDAPESSQLCRGEDSLQYRCGAKAANDLDAFIARRSLNCIPISLDRYKRTVATCSIGECRFGRMVGAQRSRNRLSVAAYAIFYGLSLGIKAQPGPPLALRRNPIIGHIAM